MKAYFYVLVAVVVTFSFLINVLFTIQLKYDNSRLTEEIYELENRLKSTHQELKKSNTDIYIQQQATERLGLTKSGETPVKVIEVANDEVFSTNHNQADIEQRKMKVFLQEWYKDINQVFEHIGPKSKN